MDFDSITVSDWHEGHPDVGNIHELSLGAIAKLLQIEEQWLAEHQTAKGV